MLLTDTGKNRKCEVMLESKAAVREDHSVDCKFNVGSDEVLALILLH